MGVRPTSWLAWYQPEAPRELLKGLLPKWKVLVIGRSNYKDG
ncbi:cyclic lactone autoinducer peptide [Neomoorella glycerini]